MKKIMAYTFLIICGVLVIVACRSSTEDASSTTSTSSTSLPDYETTTLSGTVVNTSWTLNTGRMLVPSISSGTHWFYWSNEEVSNACSSSLTATSSNPYIIYSTSGAPTVGETELCFTSDCTKTVTLYDGSIGYLTGTGKIKIDNHTMQAVTGKMYAEMGSHSKINGTFTLSRCCLSGSSYALCSGSTTTDNGSITVGSQTMSGTYSSACNTTGVAAAVSAGYFPSDVKANRDVLVVTGSDNISEEGHFYTDTSCIDHSFSTKDWNDNFTVGDQSGDYYKVTYKETGYKIKADTSVAEAYYENYYSTNGITNQGTAINLVVGTEYSMDGSGKNEMNIFHVTSTTVQHGDDDNQTQPTTMDSLVMTKEE